MNKPSARYGWESDFPGFRGAPPSLVRERLQAFVGDASREQVHAWQDAVPRLQREIDEVLIADQLAHRYSTILEYELPMESRRPDVILLVGEGVMVLELKGKRVPSQADIDQAAAYARDLRCYHRECESRDIVTVLVPTEAIGYLWKDDTGVHVAGPNVLDELIQRVSNNRRGTKPIERTAFLDATAYCPLPTLVEAARELLLSGDLRRINRANAATAPAVQEISDIVHHAATTKTRHLVLLTGLPGSGKTLVGLRTVHANYLDDLAIPREGAKPTAPAVFLSGNGPLVEVLQYELRSAGGDGKTFVRGVKDYVKRYSSRPGLVPPEHVLVFDEAQRAFDVEMVRVKHPDQEAKSEPEHFIEFAERIPDWCVVIGLIGGGQEIHEGEEAGMVQWRWAVERSARPGDWQVHAPPSVASAFRGSAFRCTFLDTLSLDTELRFHSARHLHAFVAGLLARAGPAQLSLQLTELEQEGFHLRLTRDLGAAKRYLQDRYANDPDARFGILASSRDRDLSRFGIPNSYESTRRMRLGPWYGESEDSEYSCRRLADCVTEFGAQGLELDATLLAWGTDLRVHEDRWTNELARGYRRGAKVKDAFQLRLNAYRVLMTRGRDACVLYVPPLPLLDETFDFFAEIGVRGV